MGTGAGLWAAPVFLFFGLEWKSLSLREASRCFGASSRRNKSCSLAGWLSLIAWDIQHPEGITSAGQGKGKQCAILKTSPSRPSPARGDGDYSFRRADAPKHPERPKKNHDLYFLFFLEKNNNPIYKITLFLIRFKPAHASLRERENRVLQGPRAARRRPFF